MENKGLQQIYAPSSICFGCGPANPKGLRIQSIADPNGSGIVTCDWTPEAHHEAFPGVLNGGIIGSLLDCHSNWTAAWHLMKQQKLDHPPCTVTANYSVQLLRPTPSNQPVHLEANVIANDPANADDRAMIEAKLISGGKVCATCRGLFVAVKPGHPAFHRWN